MSILVYILIYFAFVVFDAVSVYYGLINLTQSYVYSAIFTVLFLIFFIVLLKKKSSKSSAVPSDQVVTNESDSTVIDEGRVYQVEGSFDDYKKK